MSLYFMSLFFVYKDFFSFFRPPRKRVKRKRSKKKFLQSFFVVFKKKSRDGKGDTKLTNT